MNANKIIYQVVIESSTTRRHSRPAIGGRDLTATIQIIKWDSSLRRNVVHLSD